MKVNIVVCCQSRNGSISQEVGEEEGLLEHGTWDNGRVGALEPVERDTEPSREKFGAPHHQVRHSAPGGEGRRAWFETGQWSYEEEALWIFWLSYGCIGVVLLLYFFGSHKNILAPWTKSPSPFSCQTRATSHVYLINSPPPHTHAHTPQSPPNTRISTRLPVSSVYEAISLMLCFHSQWKVFDH